MAEYPRDFETLEQYRARMARKDEPLTVETDLGKVLDEQPLPVVKPGSHNARAAFKAGCEDEYSDRMRSRYGGEW